VVPRVDNSAFEFFELAQEHAGADRSTPVPLDRPIVLSKDGFPPLYAQVDEVKKVETLYGTEFQLQLRVGVALPPPLPKQAVERISISVPTDGRLRSEAPTFYYTFSSRNSTAENVSNLSDFVFSQWKRFASDRH
jgi:hypothetical protein